MSEPGSTKHQGRLHEIDREVQDARERDLQLLEDIERLSWFPMTRSPDYSAIHPHASDVSTFKSLIAAFTTDDYRDMLEERNFNGLCAYALCPNPRRHLGPGGRWKILPDGQIVLRKDIEKWCSDDCARRALYVEVQLERAAWERPALSDFKVDLLDEHHDPVCETDQVAHDLEKLHLQDESRAKQNAATLALERGETQSKSKAIRPQHPEIAIKEKETQPLAADSSSITPSGDHLMVEGHQTKLPFRTHTQA